MPILGNAFAAADALCSAAVSSVMGESMELHPWKSGRYSTAGAADPDRPVVPFTGTYSGAMGTVKFGGDRAGHDMEGTITTRERIITADLRDWPVSAQKGDRIKLLDQVGQPMLEIVAINNDGLNRAKATMVPK